MWFDRWRYVLPLRLRSLMRSTTADRELDEELRYHSVPAWRAARIRLDEALRCE